MLYAKKIDLTPFPCAGGPLMGDPFYFVLQVFPYKILIIRPTGIFKIMDISIDYSIHPIYNARKYGIIIKKQYYALIKNK